MPKPFCSSCGSTRFLVHRDGCTAWVIPVEMPAPHDQPVPVTEAENATLTTRTRRTRP